MSNRLRGGAPSGRGIGLACVATLILGACAQSDDTSPAGGAAAQPDAARPDFTGVWFPQGFARRSPNPLPFTAAAQSMVDSFAAEFAADDDPGYYCIWPGMPRVIWGAPFAIEIFHRPQDVTIYWEGYGMYRKIYMEDAPHPEPILPTAMGHSLAHWEGDTLVVRTTNLRPHPYMDDLPTTSDAVVDERYSLEHREVDGAMQSILVADITLTDPRVYTEPVTMHGEARLEPDMYILEYNCSTTLWDEYVSANGLEIPDIDALP